MEKTEKGLKKQNEDEKQKSLVTMSEYLSKTSLHGFKYIAEEGRHPCEKLLWVIFCIAAVTGTVFFLYPVFDKFCNSPVLASVDSTNVPISEVLFPAVTICNVNKAMFPDIDWQRRHNRLWKSYDNTTMLNLVDLLATTGHSYRFPSYGAEQDKILEQVLAERHENVSNLMHRVKPNRGEMLMKCWWQGKVTPCWKLFPTRLTEHGYCYSFNSMNIQDSTKTEAIPKEEASQGNQQQQQPAQPSKNSLSQVRKVHSAGINMGITVLLNPQIKEYWATSNSFYGFKVLAHSADDFAYVDQRSFVVSPGTENFAMVVPVNIKSTELVKDVKVDLRKCRFDFEDVLEIFSTYTYENCIMECKIRTMKEICKCVSYIYSVTKNKSDICDYKGMKCLAENYKTFLSLGKDEGEKTPGMECNCAASCDDTTYNTEVTSGNFPLQLEEIFSKEEQERYMRIYNLTLVQKDLILLRVYFKNLSFVQFKRDIIYTWTDLVSSFGAVVGLFLGFSIVSAVEVVYFFTIRPCLQYLKHRKTAKKQNFNHGRMAEFPLYGFNAKNPQMHSFEPRIPGYPVAMHQMPSRRGLMFNNMFMEGNEHLQPTLGVTRYERYY